MKGIITAIALLLLFIPVIAFYFVYKVIMLMMAPLLSIVAVLIVGFMACIKGEGWIDEARSALDEYRREIAYIKRKFRNRVKELLVMDFEKRKPTHTVNVKVEWEE